MVCCEGDMKPIVKWFACSHCRIWANLSTTSRGKESKKLFSMQLSEKLQRVRECVAVNEIDLVFDRPQWATVRTLFSRLHHPLALAFRVFSRTPQAPVPPNRPAMRTDSASNVEDPPLSTNYDSEFLHSTDGKLTVAIRRAMDTLDWDHLDDHLRLGPVFVCDGVAEAEWSAFTELDSYITHSNHMSWEDGKVYVVDCPLYPKSKLAREIANRIMPNEHVGKYLVNHGSSHPSHSRHEADDRIGPKWNKVQPLGAQVPHGVNPWIDFSTLTIEIGLFRRWGYGVGQLDWKARAWAATEGMQYILCLAHDIDTRETTYKLFSVEQHVLVPPEQPPQTVTVESNTTLKLSSARLLGLPLDSPLPDDIPETIEVDLSAALREGTCWECEDGQQ